MTPAALSQLDRAALLAAPDSLLVLAGGDPYVAVAADGSVTAFNGHVDLGTGIRTALAQIVAEELDVAFERVTMVLGHTGRTPDQGPTIASETIQVAAIPLRQAAATARAALLARAALWLEAAPDTLSVEDGVVRAEGTNRHVGYGELLAGQRRARGARSERTREATRQLPRGGARGRADRHPAQGERRIRLRTGREGARHGRHGRVVRPPHAGFDTTPGIGRLLLAVDEASVAAVPGLIATVVVGDFVGVVAEREEHAVQAARQLCVAWRGAPAPPDLNQPESALRAQPSTPRTLVDRGDVEAAIAGAATPMHRTYLWPYQMHASIGPSCAVADVQAAGVVVWSGTQNPPWLRADLARLLGRPEHEIEVVRVEAAGCYGRNCADDVAADAALLSRAVGRPVRVQLSREQEHAWEPKGAAQVMDVRGGLDEAGAVAGYDFTTRYPSNAAPTLALLLTGVLPPAPAVSHMGDRTAVPPYDYKALRVTVHDMAPIARAAWLRGVSALPNSFAHESWIDECATAAGIDPVEYRLRLLPDVRGAELVRAVAERAGWAAHTAPGTMGGDGDLLYGRGVAYAVYVHGTFPGTAAAWSAWIAEVAVNRQTGEVAVTRVVAGQDTGMMVNPAGVRHQVHGNVIQSVSRTLLEQVRFEAGAVASREWGGYPILTFEQVPAIEIVLMPRQDMVPLGAGESAAVPSAAAIANAIFDATGVRLREVPFTPERVRAALAPEPPPARKRGWFAALAGAVVGGLSVAAVALPWRPAYVPIARPDPAAFAPATIERGRLAAAIGACAVCHTGPGGQPFGGGRGLDTPFGRIWSSNISPDPVHGIGAWSYPAFERAMRAGVSRDGHLLYPAHPYTAFAGATDADLAALYAYLMAQPGVATAPERTRLPFPFRLRPLMAMWNTLFPPASPFEADPARSAEWNRGAYLVETLGHCGACHSPRNLLGAERGGDAHLAGGFADGWEAPSLTAGSHSPVPWTEAALYSYLRTGSARFHGSAAGPMAAVVTALAPLPDADIRAMATYLAVHPGAVDEAQFATDRLQEAAEPAGLDAGARLYAGACASCHEAGAGVALPPLGLNTNLHSSRPNNLLRATLGGVRGGVGGDMPGFADSLTDAQVEQLASYLRARFAPDKPGWGELTAEVSRVRATLMTEW